MSAVEQQYTNWVYPLPVEDMQLAIQTGDYIEIGDPIFEWPRYWPKSRSVEKLDILIAGCGTNQAAYYACRNPNWNVIGIDLSESSLAHEQKLKEKHNLKNLRIKKLDLMNVEHLGETFDYIVSSGVLHHMPNPDAGLRTLTKVLRPEGVMNLMVYGSSLRLGIYMMQEVFRSLDFRQTKEDIDLVRATINSLHPEHVLQRYIKKAEDLKYDAGIVDTFLHPQDKSYYVNEVFELTRNAGLEFVSWIDPVEYSLEDHMPTIHPLWKKILSKNKEIKYHICDLLVQDRGTHRWIAAHPHYADSIRIPTGQDSLLDCTLILNPKTKIEHKAMPENKINCKCKRYNRNFEIHYLLAQILEKLNANNSIKDIINKIYYREKDQKDINRIIIDEVTKLYESGHIYVLLPDKKLK